jgi:putative heme-binding domain-containing protein
MNGLRSCFRFGLFATVSVAWSSAAFAQRDLKDIPIPDPEEERKTLIVADGFEVSLFAADPLLHKPIQMNFDARGRLWVAASEVYPQIAPGQKANDKIVILEDTDRDGVADKTTVFADGLLIPTAVEPGDGGAYVANSTELLHLKDTDGDGKADSSRIVLSGFGTEDTHHILHTFRWGMDGMLYMNQSIYIHSHIETPYGVRRLNAGGIWQFRPETMELNVFARGWVNAWGHAFDRWGQSFVTDGAGGEGINYVVPGASYAAASGSPRLLHGLNPGSPKYCGLEIIENRHFPDDWQGNLITHDFRGHRVCRFVVSEDGAGFAARQQPDLISSNHVAFRPIDVKQGPDGALYIADWYNPIIQHGEVDFRDPRRDHTHGRIWRVTAKNRKLVERPLLAGATTEHLLEQLKSPESSTRHQAKRVLKEMGVTSDTVRNWVHNLDPKDPQFEHHRLEGLWLFQAVDHPDSLSILTDVLKSKSPEARAAAVRIIPHWKRKVWNDEFLVYLEVAVADEHPRVRLEAVRALAEFPEIKAANLALRAADHPLDQFSDYALWQSSRELAPVWLPEVVAGTFDFEGKVHRLLFAVRAAEAAPAIPLLVQKLKDGKVPAELHESLLETVASLGDADQLRLVFDLAQSAGTSPEHAATLLKTLASAKRKRNVQPSGDLSSLSDALQSTDESLRLAAIDCVGVWKLEALRGFLTAAARNDKLDAPLRTAALRGIGQLGGAASKQLLAEVTTADESESIRAAALAELVPIDTANAAKLAIAWFQKSKDAGAQAHVVTAFLQHKGGPDVLAATLDKQTLPEDAAKIAIRTVTGSGRQEANLTEALGKAGNIVSQPKALSPEEMAALVATIKQSGNPTRGEEIFRHGELNCLKCHAIGGAGGKVGPDLVSIGSSAQIDYLVESILLPNKAVKEGYHSVVVQTDDGKVITGIKVRQTDNDLLVRDVEDREFTIPLKSIEEQAPGTSLMPVGLVDKLTRAELIDLVRFLSELGKPGPYAATTARVARRWETLQPTDHSYTRMYRTSDTQVISDDAGLVWVPVYSSVSGSVPVRDVLDFTMKERLGEAARKVGFLRCRINVTTAGPVGLAVGDTTGLQLWLDGKPIDARDKQELPLSAGEHRVTVSVNLLTRKSPVRLELYDVAGSNVQVQFVSGK